MKASDVFSRPRPLQEAGGQAEEEFRPSLVQVGPQDVKFLPKIVYNGVEKMFPICLFVLVMFGLQNCPII